MPEIQWTTEAVEAKVEELIRLWEPHCVPTWNRCWPTTSPI